MIMLPAPGSGVVPNASGSSISSSSNELASAAPTGASAAAAAAAAAAALTDGTCFFGKKRIAYLGLQTQGLAVAAAGSTARSAPPEAWC